MNAMVSYLWVAGGVQLSIAVSNLWVPRILHYRDNLAKVSAIVRQVFTVHAIYLVLVLLAFSALSIFFAPELAGANSLGRFLSAFLAVFWLLRVFLQFAYYDRALRAKCRLGDIAYTLAISSLSIVYGVTALGMVR
jgi:hypothetical protein